MDLSLFSEGIFSRKPKAEDHSADIKAFHEAHAHMEEIAKRLHASGHHIHIDYKSPHALRHSKESSTHFVNVGLNTEKKIQISKKVPLRPWK